MKKLLIVLSTSVVAFCVSASSTNQLNYNDYDFSNKGRVVHLENDHCETEVVKLNVEGNVEASDSTKNECEKLAENSLSAFLIDANSNTVVFSKNEDKRLTIASMTKIMLLNLVFEAVNCGKLDLSEKILVSENASKMGGSQVFLQGNKEYLASDLVKSVIIASANDASVALAERLFGSEEACVDAMNQKRQSLGLSNTLFSNCTGLTKPTQYSSAKDVAIMLKQLVKYEKYFEYSGIWLDELKHPDGKVTTLTNTNKLIRFYKGCDGGKTGFTDEARFCLAGTSKRGTTRIIAVVIGEPTSKVRFKEVSEMFDYCFNHYQTKMIVDSKVTLDKTVKIEKGKERNLLAVPCEDYYSFCKKSEKENFEIEYSLVEKVKAPIKKGDIVGTISVFKDGVEVAKINAVAVKDVEKKNFFDAFGEVVEKWKLKG